MMLGWVIRRFRNKAWSLTTLVVHLPAEVAKYESDQGKVQQGASDRITKLKAMERITKLKVGRSLYIYKRKYNSAGKIYIGRDYVFILYSSKTRRLCRQS